MSLTRHLKDKNSSVLQYFRDRYPNTRPVIGLLNGKIRERPVLGGEGFSSYEAGLIGTAFDYRVRFYFTDDPISGSAAESASGRVDDTLSLTLAGVLQTTAGITQGLRPACRELSQADEELLDRCCLVLAHLENVYRTGRSEYLDPYGGLDGETAADQLLEGQSQEATDDLGVITQAYLQSKHTEWTKKPYTLNPTFAGSRAIGGADADLIIDRTLIELKTTKGVLSSFELYQLLGYLLLDWDDAHAIKHVAVYMARRVLLITVPAEELARTLSGSDGFSLVTARLGFKEVVEGLK